MIVEKQGGAERAKYGDELIKELSIKLTKDCGKGYTVSNIWRMKQFYLSFPKLAALRRELSWAHYKLIISLDDEKTSYFLYWRLSILPLGDLLFLKK